VAGVVALMFQKNPNLRAADVKQHLMAAARRPGGVSGPLPNSEWGAGKLDAFGAVDRVPNPSGGGGGGGGGGSGGNDGVDGPGGGGSLSLHHAAFHDEGSPRSRPKRPLAHPPVPHPFVELHRRFLRTPTGQVYAALASKHFSEVRGLINANRRVAARWHRMGGPRLLRLLAQGLAASHAVGDTQIDDVVLRERAKRFLAVLERYGSAELKKDILRYRADVLNLDGPKLAELLDLRIDPAA
jgi:hypothetical protein